MFTNQLVMRKSSVYIPVTEKIHLYMPKTLKTSIL